MTIVTILWPYSSKFTFLRLCNFRRLVHKGLVNPGSGATMGVTISALRVEVHNNIDSKPKIYSTRKLYCLVPYGANDGEWVKKDIETYWI